MIGTPTDTEQFVVDYFRVKASEAPNPTSAQAKMQAVVAFNRFMGGTPVAFADFDEALLGEWVAWMFYQGYTPATVRLYLKYLCSLHGKAVKSGLAPDTGCFRPIKAKLAALQDGLPGFVGDPQCLRKLRSLVQKDCSGTPAMQLAKDIVLFSLYNGGLTCARIAAYKKDEYKGEDTAVLEIVDRYSKPRNKYLFPLNQSVRTPNQLARAVRALFGEALDSVALSAGRGCVEPGIELWVALAMQCGVQAGEIAGCIGDAAALNPILGFAPARAMSDDGRAAIRRQVSRLLVCDTVNWYAMQFRPRVSFDMVLARAESEGCRLADTYYPMEEIAKRVGKKIVTSNKPLVPGLLFFRAKAAEVTRLYQHIGDLAWGYRQTREPRSPYAVISSSELRRYQLAIGSLTTGMEVYPAGTLEPRPGDRLEVIGGEFAGYRATYAKTLTTGTRTIYRLRLLGANAIEWVVDLSPHLLRPTTQSPITRPK